MPATKDIMVEYEQGDYTRRPLAADVRVYRGTAIGQVATTNTFRPLVAGDKFAGFAEDSYDSAGMAAGEGEVLTKTRGKIFLTVATAVAGTAVGASVYASADNTFTLVSTDNSFVGHISAYDPTRGKHIVDFYPAFQ